MADDNIMTGFVDGFSKVAEAAGFNSDQVSDLLQLAVCLGQREHSPEEFDAGFMSVGRGS